MDSRLRGNDIATKSYTLNLRDFKMSQANGKKELSHIDAAGRADMVDVGAKGIIERRAIASAVVTMSDECARKVADNNIKKGDVLATARIAGIMAAKRTDELIPLCHPLGLDHIQIDCEQSGNTIRITACVSARERTGVEMEALTAASVGALTVYDMCKALDPGMTIGPIRVESKQKDGVTSFDRS